MADTSREMQHFIADFNAAIAELEKETKEAEKSSKKGEAEIEALQNSITKTRCDIKELKDRRGEIDGEQKMVDTLLDEHLAMEQKYGEIVAMETKKLEKLKQTQNRLTSEMTTDGFDTFAQLQEKMNKRVEDVMSPSKMTQDVRDLQDRKQLEDKVNSLELCMREETQRLDELKKSLADTFTMTYSTTAEERDAAANYVRNTMVAVQKKYVSSRLDLRNWKLKRSK